MRIPTSLIITVSLAGLYAFTVTGQERGPIPEIKLDRKDPISYEKDVEPILKAKCLYCHSGNVLEGNYDMSNHAAVLKGGKKGQAVVAGKSSESWLYKLSSRTVKPYMPPKTEEPLNAEELAIIKLWIDQGARPPSGPSIVSRPKVVLTLPHLQVKPSRAVVITPDKALVIASRGNELHVYETKKGDYVKPLVDADLKLPDGKQVPAASISIVESMAIAPNGQTLAVGGFREVSLWNFPEGKVVHRLTDFNDRVVALAFSPDGKWLAAGGGPAAIEGELKVFDMTQNPPKLVVDLKTAHSDTVYGVCFSPDGRMLASAAADKVVKIHSLPDGKFVKSLEGHTNHVLDVGWRADGKLLASGSADNTIKVWDFEKGEQVRTMKGHGNQITRLQFIGNTPQIATASGDLTVRMWNVDNGGTVRTFGGNSEFLYSLAVSNDGQLVATGGEDGVVRLFNGTNAQLIKALLPPNEQPTNPKR
jgi:WD40 repeat protein